MNPLLAIYVWPIVVITLFQKYRAALALLISVIAGYLLLPERTEIDLPLLPALNKNTIPILVSLIMAMVVLSRMKSDRVRPGWLPRSWIARILMIAFVVGAFMTVATNGDGLTYGPTYLQGLRPYDAFSVVLSMIFILLPLVLARKFLSHPSEHRVFLMVLCIAGLLYSLPSLYEVRMSPQLNAQIYGFFPHSWVQHIRGNGYRPLVFLQHGLFLAIFLSASVLATVGLLRLEGKDRRMYLVGALLWLLMTLVLAKSLGALVITLALAPLILFLGVRTQLIAAAVIAGIVLTYPMVRGSGLVPVDRILTAAESINPQRAESFQVRVNNEEALLERVQQRMLFGWGGYGRSRIFNENGHDISIADGYWIIVLGLGGWVRYLSEFGLLTISIFLLVLHKRRYDVGLETSTLVIILAGNLTDLLPNAGITPVTWMVAGALWGRLELKNVESSVSEDADVSPTANRGRRQPRKTRQFEDMSTTEPKGTGAAYTRQRNRIDRKSKPPK